MRALLLLVILAGCAAPSPRVGPWTVAGAADPAAAAQALELVEAARRVYGPGTLLDYAGRAYLGPEVATLCYGALGRGHPVSGCAFGCGGVCILWPHPSHPGCADLAGCSALAHELAHVAGAQSEAEAEAGGARIVQEWRRGGGH